MNESNFKNLIQAYREVQMTPDEKREVFKQSLLVIEKIQAVSLVHGDNLTHEYLNTNLETQLDSVNTPIGQTGLSTALKTWFIYIKKRQFVPALVSAFLLLFTGGASLMADQALPGDSLYSFKVNVNEPIRELTAITTEARAKLAVDMTEKRLQEAAVLSVQGKLDDTNKNLLKGEFTKQAEQIRNRVASLVSRNDLNAAQEVVIDFESALKTHEFILQKLALNDKNSASSTTNGENAFIFGSSSVAVDFSTSSDISITPTKSTAFPSSDVSGLLIAIKSELDINKTARIDIEEKATVNLSVIQSSTSTNSSPVQMIESNVRELKLTISDIQSEIKNYTYSVSTLEFVNQRILSASSSITEITALIKTNNIRDAVTISQKTFKSLSEAETILKIEKSSGDAFSGKLDIGLMIYNSKINNFATSTFIGASTTSFTSGTIIK